MHNKYIKNNLRTFVEFWDQSIYALFRPAPRVFTFAPPRPSLVLTPQYHFMFSQMTDQMEHKTEEQHFAILEDHAVQETANYKKTTSYVRGNWLFSSLYPLI